MVAKKVERRCGYCRGSGKINEGDFVKTIRKCPVCDGHGTVMVPSNWNRKCYKCKGEGEIESGTYFSTMRQCGECEGTGWGPPPPAYGR